MFGHSHSYTPDAIQWHPHFSHLLEHHAPDMSLFLSHTYYACPELFNSVLQRITTLVFHVKDQEPSIPCQESVEKGIMRGRERSVWEWSDCHSMCNCGCYYRLLVKRAGEGSRVQVTNNFDNLILRLHGLNSDVRSKVIQSLIKLAKYSLITLSYLKEC